MIKNPASKIPFEHERRFVPKLEKLPFDFKRYPVKHILQGYLNDSNRTRVRDERTGEKHLYLRTIKTGEGVSRREDESEITREEFNLFWEQAVCSLTKSRYFISWDGVDVQLNIFHTTLDGYVQMEVEFDSHQEALAFEPPAWLGFEVTDDNRHGNYSLAKFGLPE